jgi:Flp pilus assembly protein TadD
MAAALGEQARDARKQVAYALIQFRRHAEALGLLDTRSRDGHEQNLIGVCCSELGRYTAALAAYRKSRKFADGWNVPWDNMGFVHLRMGEVEKAIEIHRAVIAADEAYPWAHYHLGLALAARGELAAAETELARAVELGYSVASVREDPYAQPLRETPTYRRLIDG